MGRRKWREYQKLVLSHEEDYSMEAKDWEPTDKCSLCVDQGDGDAQHDPVPQRASSAGSVGSVSADDSTDPFPAVTASAMTTLESVASSMAASLAAVAALSHGKPPAGLYPPPGLFPWYLTPEPPKPSPPAPEQPLDLSKSSSKSPEPPAAPQVDTPPAHQHLVPSPSLKVPAALNRLYKAKPRLSAVAGRRTYTEDELQAALRDIQSGKLGTRRAAVIYGIPRSTLRNKVYKLAMERERDAHLVMPEARVLLADKDDDDLPEDDEDKDSGAEEEREVEKALMRPIISIDDFMRLSSEGGGYPGTDSLRTLLQHGSKYMGDKKDDESPSPPVFPVFPSPGGTDWTGMDHAALGPYINRLLGGNPLTPSNPFAMAGSRHSPTERSPTDSPGDFVSKFSHLDLVRRMMLEERMLQEEQQRKERQFLNGSRLGEPGPSSSVGQDDETSGSGTPPNVILRIPSFKPTPKNGMPGETPIYPLGVQTGESTQHSLNSPPISAGRSESSSPPSLGKRISVSLTDVIAKSISQKFQQPTDLHHLPHTPPGLEHFSVRRPDFSQPLGCSPPIMRNHNNNHVEDRKVSVPTSKHSSGNSSGSTGGKGTRPKRGKYRNYDRDSLVEAVRAVQRGEMSVHRAGSYYGVPHSTLEYKVKERHLMRPRKREPKSVQEEIKLKEDSIASRVPPPVDKCKLLPPTKPPKTPFTPPSSLPAGPNGLKMPPMFDPSIPYSATGHPFPFWHPGTFPHLPIEYRNPNFPPTPDHFFASQMIQRLQGDSTRTPHSPPPTLGKTARELAETLYDGSGTNGSFLDGIIRSSLESSGLPVRGKEGELKRQGPENMSNKALLDQLCRNSKMTPVPKAEASSSDDETSKRAINQNRTCDEEDVPVAEGVEVKQEVSEEAEQNPPTDPEENAEPEKEAKPEYSNLKTDNVDESACDSNHTIKRVKLEEET